MNPLIILGISFVLLVTSSVMYMLKEETHWKELKAAFLLSNTNSKEAVSLAQASQDSILKHKLLINSVLEKYESEHKIMLKTISDNHDHFNALSQSFIQLQNDHKALKDQVHGYRISLPQQISITLTKDVKSESRDNTKKSIRPVKDSQVRRFKAQTKIRRNS